MRLVFSELLLGLLIRRAIAFTTATLLLSVLVGQSDGSDILRGSEALNHCQTLKACLANLDRVPKTPFGATSDDDPKVSQYLQRFGDPAKSALLERAASSDPGWSNYAGALLMDWPDFTPEDVPALIAALKRQPGGWISRPLGRIGTPDAIKALADDVGEHGTMSQSGFALQKLGGKAVPYLMPLLEKDQSWRDVADILSNMGDAIAFMAPKWIAQALDSNQPEAKRVAALRALGAIASLSSSQGPKLRPLLHDPSRAIREAATITLHRWLTAPFSNRLCSPASQLRSRIQHFSLTPSVWIGSQRSEHARKNMDLSSRSGF